MKIKKILVSQPETTSAKSSYEELTKKHNIKIEFRPFIKVEGVSAKEFRVQRIDLSKFSAVLFTSKTAIDNYFRLCEELRITIPDSMKYFCVTESIAFYLQKYIVYRKRKIFFGEGRFQDLMPIMQKHKDEYFFVPLSDPHKKEIPETLDKNSFKYKISTLYRTVNTDLSDLSALNYDILVFYSPSGIRSLKSNFPDFEQKDIKIASFGTHTAKAVQEAGLRLDIEAPSTQAPSMTMALDQFIMKFNKIKKK
ncbi:MAG: uroporphyrinogen-III synthase [Bacteroidetes bacterium]|jgi:uroporphyrinogen-III synthase|nr:uroporphyrinogen-III synthase [Bacteroidota bacterium]